jgi:hypothetical protein
MTGMRVRDFFLANHAESRGGLTYISGAFPEWWDVPVLPFGTPIGFVLLLDYENNPDESVQLSIEKHGPKGLVQMAQLQVSRGNQVTDVPGAPRYQPVVINHPVIFDSDGAHEFVLYRHSLQSVGTWIQDELAKVPLWVRLVPSPLASDEARADDKAG